MVRLALRGLAAIILLVLVSCLGYGYAQGYRIYTVPSNSMRPQFRAGDALLVRQGGANLAAGTVVSFRDSSRPWLIISHRIVAVAANQRLITKGDNNPGRDLPIEARQVIGEARYVLPRLGSVVSWIRTPQGLVLAVYLPALITIGLVLRPLLRPAHRYRLR